MSKSRKTKRHVRKSGQHGKRGQAGRDGGQQKRMWAGIPRKNQWNAWLEHLADRRQPVALTDLIARRGKNPLRWVLPDACDGAPAHQPLKQLLKLGSKKKQAATATSDLARDWLETLPGREPDAMLGLECLAWCHALPRIAPVLAHELWCQLAQQLAETVELATGLNLQDSPTTHQLLAGELPLALSYQFPEIKTFHREQSAARALSFGVCELLDGEGLPHARHLNEMRSLLACWTRCSMMGSATGRDCFDEDARNQYEWLVRQALRLCRPDGTHVLSDGSSGAWCPDLFAAALHENNDLADDDIACYILPGGRAEDADRKPDDLPEPTVYSEWAEAVVMRAKWSRKSPQLTVTFANRSLRSELAVAGRLIWSGEWITTLCVQGTPLETQSGWREVCWFTDSDVDYLELEVDLSDGWAIQRQVLLSRSDHFLFLADAVIGPRPAQVEYRSRWPLAERVQFEAEDQTRDGCLGDGKPLSTVLPLSLPEWQVTSATGSLQSVGNQLELTQSEQAQRLYAPLFFDLSRRRFAKERTWRQLAVAERLVPQPPDAVVGYRVQVGQAQWLLYRSLAPKANRTVLGQNLSNEFLVGRFKKDGCVQELIEIE
jgi:hypothetical protein